jgi:hypothetical protein
VPGESKRTKIYTIFQTTRTHIPPPRYSQPPPSAHMQAS